MTDLTSSSPLIPFSRSPQGDMFFGSGAFAEALARLQLMVTNSCLGVLTGEVGSGKSPSFVVSFRDWIRSGIR